MVDSADAHASSAAGKRKHPPYWDDLLTDRSKKFYDETYRWDGTDGFWDEQGIYHKFNDPEDPDASPPTPGPVWLEEEEGSVEQEEEEGEEVSEDVPSLMEDMGTSPPEKIRENTMLSNEEILAKFLQDGAYAHGGSSPKKALLRDDLFLDHPNRERLLGHIEGILVGKSMFEMNMSLIDSYKLCGMETPSALLAEADVRASDAASPADADLEGQDVSLLGEDQTPGSVTFEFDPQALSNVEEDAEGQDSSLLSEEKTPGSVSNESGQQDVSNVKQDAQGQVVSLLGEDNTSGPASEESNQDVSHFDIDETADDLNEIKLEATAAPDDKVVQDPSSASSPLSDCPSDLSNWDVDDQVDHPSRANTPKSALPLKSDDPDNENKDARDSRTPSAGAKKRSGKARASSVTENSSAGLPVRRRSTRIFLASK